MTPDKPRRVSRETGDDEMTTEQDSERGATGAELAREIEALAAKATEGTWEVDTEYDEDALYSGGGGCGRGFKNYFIGSEVNGKWRTLLDTQNSDHKLIEVEYDEDGGSAWDETGRNNSALIVALKNNLPTILTALREADALRAENASLRAVAGELARDLGAAASYVIDSLEAHEHSDGRELFNRILVSIARHAQLETPHDQ